MKILLFVIVFFILGALLIISNNNLALYDSSNMKIFFTSYSNWIENVYTNAFDLTEKVIEFEWLPKNE